MMVKGKTPTEYHSVIAFKQNFNRQNYTPLFRAQMCSETIREIVNTKFGRVLIRGAGSVGRAVGLDRHSEMWVRFCL